MSYFFFGRSITVKFDLTMEAHEIGIIPSLIYLFRPYNFFILVDRIIETTRKISTSTISNKIARFVKLVGFSLAVKIT